MQSGVKYVHMLVNRQRSDQVNGRTEETTATCAIPAEKIRRRYIQTLNNIDLLVLLSIVTAGGRPDTNLINDTDEDDIG